MRSETFRKTPSDKVQLCGWTGNRATATEVHNENSIINIDVLDEM